VKGLDVGFILATRTKQAARFKAALHMRGEKDNTDICGPIFNARLHESIRCAAPQNGYQRTQDDGRSALAGAEPVSTLAARHGVSRPLVYRQKCTRSTPR